MKLRTAFGAAAAITAAALALSGCAQKSTATQGGGAGDVKTVRVFISGDTNIQKLWDMATSGMHSEKCGLLRGLHGEDVTGTWGPQGGDKA